MRPTIIESRHRQNNGSPAGGRDHSFSPQSLPLSHWFLLRVHLAKLWNIKKKKKKIEEERKKNILVI